MGERVVNNFSKPLTLDNGTILAASGHKGSQRDDVELSERDRRRYVTTGRIVILEPEPGEKAKIKPARSLPTQNPTEEVK